MFLFLAWHVSVSTAEFTVVADEHFAALLDAVIRSLQGDQLGW